MNKMGIADRLVAAGGVSDQPEPQPELAVQEVPDAAARPAPAASAPAKAPDVAQEFDPAWWNGLGYQFAGDGLWAPAPKAVLMCNGQKAQYRKVVAGGGDPLTWIESKWAQWYPGLGRAKSRTEFHALWICIRWSCEEAQRIVTGEAA